MCKISVLKINFWYSYELLNFFTKCNVGCFFGQNFFFSNKKFSQLLFFDKINNKLRVSKKIFELALLVKKIFFSKFCENDPFFWSWIKTAPVIRSSSFLVELLPVIYRDIYVQSLSGQNQQNLHFGHFWAGVKLYFFDYIPPFLLKLFRFKHIIIH